MDRYNKIRNYSEDLMKNMGLKEKQKQIMQKMKEEERKAADDNQKQQVELERQAQYKQSQMRHSLAQQYEQSIKEKRAKQMADLANNKINQYAQEAIGTKLSLQDSWNEQERKRMEREYRNNLGTANRMTL